MTRLAIPDIEISARWERGLSVSAIAKALGVSQATIKWRVEALGLAPKAGRTPDRVNRLIKAWADGVPVMQIAQDLGLSAESVRIWARDYDLAPRDPGAWRKVPFDADLLRRLWADGVSAQGVAERLGVAKPTVYSWARKLKLPVPNPACAAAGSPAARVRGAARAVLGAAHEAPVLAGLRCGLSQRHVAADLGVSEATLRRFIARRELAPAPDAAPAPEPVVAPEPAPRLPRVRVAVVAAPPTPAPAPAPALPPFDADLAKALTWSDIWTIAARHGKSLSLAQSRWHRLRRQVAA